MKLSNVLIVVGVLSISASIYSILRTNSWDTILPGLLCGISLSYFGIIERKKEKRNEENKN